METNQNTVMSFSLRYPSIAVNHMNSEMAFGSSSDSDDYLSACLYYYYNFRNHLVLRACPMPSSPSYLIPPFRHTDCQLRIPVLPDRLQ